MLKLTLKIGIRYKKLYTDMKIYYRACCDRPTVEH